MQAEKMRQWLPDLEALSVDAGHRILDVYHSEEGMQVVAKDDDSPLTRADLASHRTIVNRLTELTPDIPVMSEESSGIDYDTRRHWERFWLVDPLDGTKEFIKRNGEFTVNIALIEGQRPVLGVVHVPVTQTTYFAAVGEGAWRRDGEETAHAIAVAGKAHEPLRVAGSRSHAGSRLKAYLERLGEHELVSMGSSLKLVLVAEGKADLYPRLGPTSEWDTAAAQCVVEQAGGMVTDVSMQPLQYNKPSILNPEFFVFGDNSRNWSEYLES